MQASVRITPMSHRSGCYNCIKTAWILAALVVVLEFAVFVKTLRKVGELAIFVLEL
jgi:hypothetical protein